MSESGTKMHKLEKDSRVHSYTQPTMSYYSQLGKKQNFTFADGTHEMNMANVIQSIHDNFECIKCGPEYICTCCDQLWY